MSTHLPPFLLILWMRGMMKVGAMARMPTEEYLSNELIATRRRLKERLREWMSYDRGGWARGGIPCTFAAPNSAYISDTYAKYNPPSRIISTIVEQNPRSLDFQHIVLPRANLKIKQSNTMKEIKGRPKSIN
ncbi:hypothetical protein M422DRAFT_51504 [Sphaerobolus stellatus SS14]|uniref:Uncharacterized protein n=1 Tax=Sphaerobolus stellatus (strain SS14) TaxID=990650 RepID=A0A0C9V188_SPHS4|nr:hypothetical protein M422DRAFT_51504 [Sphaerobolus stellatus SS14]